MKIGFFLTGIFMKNRSNCFGMNVAGMHGKFLDMNKHIFFHVLPLSPH